MLFSVERARGNRIVSRVAQSATLEFHDLQHVEVTSSHPQLKGRSTTCGYHRARAGMTASGP